MPTLAVISNTGLGDALWMMIVSENYRRAGYSVTLYSDLLYPLQSLFPHTTILPYPKEIPYHFDTLYFQQYSPGSRNDIPSHATVLHKEKYFDLTFSYAQNLVNFCAQKLGKATLDIGIQIPADWTHRKYKNRVIIHPLSASPLKNWKPSQFIRLAKHLQEDGYEPFFILPPSDKERFSSLLKQAHLPEPLSLPWLSLAQLIYESGYFIGNDASPGHLASALHIPTLSLFSRKSRATFYRPAFFQGEIVLPFGLLPGRTLRNHYWQLFLPVTKALSAFKKLCKTSR